MAIRLYRAYSPGTRSKSVSYFDDLTQIKPERTLTFGKRAISGRNNRGVITVKGRGGGHKRKYRVVDFQRKSQISAKVSTIEYDPNPMFNSGNYLNAEQDVIKLSEEIMENDAKKDLSLWEILVNARALLKLKNNTDK